MLIQFHFPSNFEHVNEVGRELVARLRNEITLRSFCGGRRGWRGESFCRDFPFRFYAFRIVKQYCECELAAQQPTDVIAKIPWEILLRSHLETLDAALFVDAPSDGKLCSVNSSPPPKPAHNFLSVLSERSSLLVLDFRQCRVIPVTS